MDLAADKPLGRILRDFRHDSGVAVRLIPLFSGVDLLGVFCSGGRVGVCLLGVDCAVGDCFDGVVGARLERDGVPAAETLPDRLVTATFADSERSR